MGYLTDRKREAAQAMKSDEIKYKENCDYFLSKPVSQKKLINTIKDALKDKIITPHKSQVLNKEKIISKMSREESVLHMKKTFESELSPLFKKAIGSQVINDITTLCDKLHNELECCDLPELLKIQIQLMESLDNFDMDNVRKQLNLLKSEIENL